VVAFLSAKAAAPECQGKIGLSAEIEILIVLLTQRHTFTIACANNLILLPRPADGCSAEKNKYRRFETGDGGDLHFPAHGNFAGAGKLPRALANFPGASKQVRGKYNDRLS
jgi:hypothetical protein